MTDMIKTTTTDILKNGVKNRRDGYCYLVTPENYDFWCDFTNNCSSIQSSLAFKTREWFIKLICHIFNSFVQFLSPVCHILHFWHFCYDKFCPQFVTFSQILSQM